MNILFAIWSFFATYILQKAPYMVGFLTLLGYCLMGKKWYDTLGGTLKAIIGMLILNAGSGGLTSNFRPILAGLKDRFGLTPFRPDRRGHRSLLWPERGYRRR